MTLVYEPPPFLNETEWQTCRDPKRMLFFLCYHWRQNLPRWLQPAKTSRRKLRLLACECARLDPDVTDENRGLIELAERYADGSASKEEVTAFHSGMLLLPVEEQTDELSVPLWWWMTRDMLQGGVRNIAVVTDWIAQEVGASANDRHAAFHASFGD